MQKDIGYILVTLGSAQEFALYLASMQTAGPCLIHLEPKNFTLCDPQQTSIQHVNINFTLQKLQSQGALQRKSFACSVPSHGILPKDTLRAGLESIRGLGNRQHTGGGWDHSSPSPWMDHPRHCLDTLHFHRSLPRWNSRAPVTTNRLTQRHCVPHQSPLHKVAASRGGNHSTFHDLIQAEEDLPIRLWARATHWVTQRHSHNAIDGSAGSFTAHRHW